MLGHCPSGMTGTNLEFLSIGEYSVYRAWELGFGKNGRHVMRKQATNFTLTNVHFIVLEKIPEFEEFMKRNYPPNFKYQDFGPQFTAEFYNATQWVEIFKKAGAR